MKLFGYKGCDEIRKDKVIICRKHSGCEITVAEQLSAEEAKKCYNELKKLYLDENVNLEFEDVDKDIYFIPKDEIGKIEWVKYN